MSTKLDKTDIALKENIAARIKELREATGVRLSKFASDNDIEKQVQSRIEGGRGATIYTVNKFCKSVGISLSEFFDDPKFKE